MKLCAVAALVFLVAAKKDGKGHFGHQLHDGQFAADLSAYNGRNYIEAVVKLEDLTAPILDEATTVSGS